MEPAQTPSSAILFVDPNVHFLHQVTAESTKWICKHYGREVNSRKQNRERHLILIHGAEKVLPEGESTQL